MDNLSLAQWSADPAGYTAAYNREHRREMRAHSETLQRHVSHHAWDAQAAFRAASPTPGVVTRAAMEAAQRAGH